MTRGEGTTSLPGPCVPERETHRTEPVDLALLADMVAVRVVEMLRPSVPAADGPLAWTTGDVARELGRSADWVREHRQELGLLPAVGERPRLMFDPAAVRAWATARHEDVRSVAPEPAPTLAARRPRAARIRTDVDLIPIRGDRSAA